MELSDFRPGDRVQLHPATDLWMRGDKWGTVKRVTGQKVHVALDRSKRTVRLAPENIGVIADPCW